VHRCIARVVRTIVPRPGIQPRRSSVLHGMWARDHARLENSRPGLAALSGATAEFVGGWSRSTNDRGASGNACDDAVEPTALAMRKPHGEWEKRRGAEIVVAQGKPLGVTVAERRPAWIHGPCRSSHVWQMPQGASWGAPTRSLPPATRCPAGARAGIAGARKANSNICTNHGLAVNEADNYLALLGTAGLRAWTSRRSANALKARTAIELDARS